MGEHGWLGHRRLAIMAPEDGKQPLVQGGVAWASNSEIYNSEMLMGALAAEAVCAADSKAIGPVLSRYGVRGLEMLDGQFAIAWIDDESGHWIVGAIMRGSARCMWGGTSRARSGSRAR